MIIIGLIFILLIINSLYYFYIPALSSFSSDTEGLILIGQMNSISVIEVKRLDLVGVGAVEILGTTRWGKVVVITRILTNLNICNGFILTIIFYLCYGSLWHYLNGEHSAWNSGSNTLISKLEYQVITVFIGLNVHLRLK